MFKHKVFFKLFCLGLIVFFVSCSFNKSDNTPDTSTEDTEGSEDESKKQKKVDYENKNFNPSLSVLEETGIPVLRINTSDGEAITSKTEWKDADFELLGAHCNYEDLSLDDIEIKGRGNSTWGLPKKSYSIKFGSKSKVLGMKKHKRWVLVANYSDKSLLRNNYASYLGNNIYNTVWNPSFKSVHLILNGVYRGVYILGEQIKIDGNRVDIDEISETPINGGFICEVNIRFDEDFNFRTTKNVPFSLKDPDEVSIEIQQEVQRIIQTAEDALYANTFTNNTGGWRDYIDEDSVIDWFIVNEFTKNDDARFYTSVYMYYNHSDGKLYLGPNWDFDISCGNINFHDCDKTSGFRIKNAAWISRMFEDPGFVANVKTRWNSTKSDLYQSVNTWIPSQAASLEDAAQKNFSRWRILGNYVWPNADGYATRKTYQSEIDYLVNWLNARYTWLDSTINGW